LGISIHTEDRVAIFKKKVGVPLLVSIGLVLIGLDFKCEKVEGFHYKPEKVTFLTREQRSQNENRMVMVLFNNER
jgi:hypothetical protein